MALTSGLLASCKDEPPSPPPPAALIAVAENTVKTPTVSAAPTPQDLLRKEGYAYVRAVVRANLEAAISDQVGSELGPALAQVVNRALVWWIDPRTDLRPGDEVEVVYQPRAGEEPVAHAIWYRSQKHAKTYEAARVQLDGARYARWYQPDGSELELRLVGGPIDEYEQITSLINDGRRHKGVDFKTSVGTAVTAPFDGTVVRKNWAMRGNGTCLELRDARTGHSAYFLHLSSIADGVTVGGRVKRGQVIAQSGNTGHSTAPHLHYQLVNGNKILDPFRFHKTQREKLEDGAIGKIGELLGRLGKLRTKQHDAVGDL
jgi:murein DD-endopeptidase